MPITQDRMLALIEALERSHKNLKNWHETAKVLKEAARREILTELETSNLNPLAIGKITERTLDANINISLESQPSPEDAMLLYGEKLHFRYRKSQNDYSRERMRRVRAETTEGISERPIKHSVSAIASIQPGSPAALKEIQRRAREAGVILDAEGNIVDEPPAEPYLLPSQRPRPAPEPQHPAPESHISPHPAPESQHPVPIPNDDEEIHAQQIRANDARAFETGEDLPP